MITRSPLFTDLLPYPMRLPVSWWTGFSDSNREAVLELRAAFASVNPVCSSLALSGNFTTFLSLYASSRCRAHDYRKISPDFIPKICSFKVTSFTLLHLCSWDSYRSTALIKMVILLYDQTVNILTRNMRTILCFWLKAQLQTFLDRLDDSVATCWMHNAVAALDRSSTNFRHS